MCTVFSWTPRLKIFKNEINYFGLVTELMTIPPYVMSLVVTMTQLELLAECC